MIMLSCRKATELIEQQLYFRLSPLEKVKLRMHLLMCDYCTRYKKQSLFIHELLCRHDQDHHTSGVTPEEKNPHLQEKIMQEIENF